MNQAQGKFCPCCSFDLELFLPDSEKQGTRTCATIDSDNDNDNNNVEQAPEESLPNIAETLRLLVSENENDDSSSVLPIVIIDTHGHAQLDRERDETYRLDLDLDLNMNMNMNMNMNLNLDLDLNTTPTSSTTIPDATGESLLLCGDRNSNRFTDTNRNRNRNRNRNHPCPGFQVKSVVCSVEPADFKATLKHASNSDSILPALGIHPWYIANLPNVVSSSSIVAPNANANTNANTNANSVDGDDVGVSDNNDHDEIDSEWLLPMERLLLEHPNCLVGEIGLCKIARWVRTHPSGKAAAMQIQKRVFVKQMALAAKLRRPVSVHCVDSHGIFVAALSELVEAMEAEAEAAQPGRNANGGRRHRLPPAIAMHSFTGTAHHVRELLELEHRIDFPDDRSRTTRQKKKKTKKTKKKNTTTESDHETGRDAADAVAAAAAAATVASVSSSPSPPPPPLPPLFYFGFSHTVNYAMCTSDKSRARGREAVKAVPLDRLLVESDVHSESDVAGGTIGAISYVSWARNLHPRAVVAATTTNGSAFLQSLLSS
eukprot:jgi/Psemu1/12661/gm1.12661_g